MGQGLGGWFSFTFQALGFRVLGLGVSGLHVVVSFRGLSEIKPHYQNTIKNRTTKRNHKRNDTPPPILGGLLVDHLFGLRLRWKEAADPTSAPGTRPGKQGLKV